ncbi:ComEC/Rec2 family competence protein [Breznakiella homolactica]|uniref:MBL fold metallo-hydrolase n=1 Tax=Breznakiella homolactica TaxID=2798577 RepID=A0A7T7XKX0_9SPIR|nr:MBL fold metallo-hydrolase [Breznakiella homolactica]QQO08310.1 MBL fold metallo-hydrolase [Breznakiella homolactica]
MNRKVSSSGKFLFLAAALAALILGCGATSRDGGEPAAGRPAEQVSADRYSEIIGRRDEAGNLTVYFLDLSVENEAEDKSGDSSLVIFPEGSVMLVDTGHPESAGDILAFLRDMGITKIDRVVLSHPHIDHIGGFSEIARVHEIGEVYQIEMDYPTDTYRQAQDTIRAMGIPARYLKRGDRVTLEDTVSMEIFNPEETLVYPQDFPDNSTQFVNNSSIVMKFTYGDSSVIMAGDIYSPRERDLTDQFGERLRADVAKATHHGADTSNSNRWIRTVRPLIVVSMHDVMGSMAVYNNYRKSGTDYYHTLYDGIVRVRMDSKQNYTVTTRFDSWLRQEE